MNQRYYQDFIEIQPAGGYSSYHLIPDNRSEFIIPQNEMLAEVIGYPTQVIMKPGSFYLLTPRSRAMLLSVERKSCYIMKVEPTISAYITASRREVAQGAFELPEDCHIKKDVLRCTLSTAQLSNYLGLKKSWSRNEAAKRAILHIKESKGNITIDELAKSTMVSVSMLEKRFSSEIGLSPKHFCKVERFIHFISLIKADGTKTFTQAAHLSGYYDQSHLIKDFKDLTKLTPSLYFKNNPYPQAK